MNLVISYYKTILLSTQRGHGPNGMVSNAKPLFLLSIFQLIESGIIIENHFNLLIPGLNEEYAKQWSIWESGGKVSPITNPFFHLSKEQYYFIKWKTGIACPSYNHTPSAKFLRENVEYASLDEGLWNLLQDKDVRNELREVIVNFFLKK